MMALIKEGGEGEGGGSVFLSEFRGITITLLIDTVWHVHLK